MIINPANNLRTIAVYLGSLAADVTIPVASMGKKVRIVAARLMNGAAIAGADNTHVAVNLKVGSTVIASLDTDPDEQGSLVKNIAKSFDLDADQSLLSAGSDLTCQYDETEYAGVPEISRIVCRADDTDDLTGTGFILYDDAGSVGVFFDNGNAGATAPTDVGAAARVLEVNTQATDSTAQQVATALAAKLDADSKFIAIVDPEDDTAVIVTSSLVGTRVDIADSADGATDFDFSVDQQGAGADAAVALTGAQLVIDFYPL